MNLKKVLKITCILMIIVVFINVGNVFGAVNEGYHADTVSENWISSVVTKSNVLIDPIMRFLYWIATVIEYLIGSVAAITSGGVAVFPWADAVLFNAVPLLDVNFFNPASGSLITLLDDVLIKTYMTIFSVSVAFFSLIVLVMAVKLAISTIASDKAKYKEELLRWVASLVLLFTVHFFMSFVFYANESAVKVASGIVNEELQNVSFEIKDMTQVNSLLEKNMDAWFQSGSVDQANADFINANVDFYMALLSEDRDTVLKKFFNSDKWYVDNSTEVQWLVGFGELIINMDADLLSDIQNYTKGDGTGDDIKDRIEAASDGKLGSGSIALDDQLDTWKYLTKKYYNTFNPGSANYGTGDVRTPITDLATFFRRNSFQVKSGKIVPDEPNYMFILLYLIFCVQSLMYVLAYIKRLFYIVLLALMAPVIVLFNYASGIAGKASALSKWIKEFTSLVFIQTIQAFILSIIVVIIAVTASTAQGGSTSTTNSALGVVGIVALASISKVEVLVKKILGVESSITDASLKGGMKSWMTGLAAAKVAMRVKDNFKKVGSGISTQRSLNKEELKLKRRYANRLSLYNDQNNGAGGATGAGGNAGYSEPTNLADTGISGDTGALGGAGTTGGTGGVSGRGANVGTKGKVFDRKDAISIQDLQDNYEDKLKELKKKKSEARWNTVKGITETGGAILGGATGAAIGASTGELDDVIKSAGFGIGVGDWIGEKSVDFTQNRIDNVSAIRDFTKKEYNRIDDLLSNRKSGETIRELYKDRGNEARFKKEYMSVRTQAKNMETKIRKQKEALNQKLKDSGLDINNI